MKVSTSHLCVLKFFLGQIVYFKCQPAYMKYGCSLCWGVVVGRFTLFVHLSVYFIGLGK